MDKEQKQVIERLENIVYLYNRESRGWYDCNDIRLNSNDIKAIEKAIELIKAIPSADMFSDLRAEISMYENSEQSIDEMIQGIKSIISIYER